VVCTNVLQLDTKVLNSFSPDNLQSQFFAFVGRSAQFETFSKNESGENNVHT
jgi:hypothetical protein